MKVQILRGLALDHQKRTADGCNDGVGVHHKKRVSSESIVAAPAFRWKSGAIVLVLIASVRFTSILANRCGSVASRRGLARHAMLRSKLTSMNLVNAAGRADRLR
jgi:hypothetical protein